MSCEGSEREDLREGRKEDTWRRWAKKGSGEKGERKKERERKRKEKHRTKLEMSYLSFEIFTRGKKEEKMNHSTHVETVQRVSSWPVHVALPIQLWRK